MNLNNEKLVKKEPKQTKKMPGQHIFPANNAHPMET